MGLYFWAGVPWEDTSLSDSAQESRRAQVYSCWVFSLRWSHSSLACGWARGGSLHIYQLFIYLEHLFCVGQSWEQQWQKALGPVILKSVILWETKAGSQMVMFWCGQGRDRDWPCVTRPQGRKVFSHRQKVLQHVQSGERTRLTQEFKLLCVTRLWATYTYREKREELDRKANRQGSGNQLWRFPRSSRESWKVLEHRFPRCVGPNRQHQRHLGGGVPKFTTWKYAFGDADYFKLIIFNKR